MAQMEIVFKNFAQTHRVELTLNDIARRCKYVTSKQPPFKLNSYSFNASEEI